MSAETVPSTEVLAQKRGGQTLAQGLGIDVLVALALVILAELPNATSWVVVAERWPILALLLAKSIVQAVASWVIRRWFDPNRHTGDPTSRTVDLTPPA